MNYSELITNVREYTEVDSNGLPDSILNVFITNIENKIARQMDSDDQRRYAFTSCEVNNAFIDVSTLGGSLGGFRFARGLQLVNSDNTREWVEQRDTTFMAEYALTRSDPTSATNGKPKYWANWDQNTLILSPTPDQAYTVELWYVENPEHLDTSNSSSTTFVSTNAPEVLLYGVISEAYSYLKNTQDMQLYEGKYQVALQDFAQEQMGRKRRDEYQNGVLRIPMKSLTP
jgi:hypothetical protein